ncbi:hypothetical protein IMZ48_08515 [Candidatus Bathyarchaeota archaeon]|nr:hypothetical protein [Candidatus Bathyarchaeota archaeon]
MDDLTKLLTAFPRNSDKLETDSQYYHKALDSHVKSLEGHLRKYQSILSSSPEQILNVRLPHYTRRPQLWTWPNPHRTSKPASTRLPTSSSSRPFSGLNGSR